MKKHLNRLVPLILLPAIMAACAPGDPAPSDNLRKVKLDNPAKAPDFTDRKFPGTVREASEVNLSFRVGGPLESMLVREGEYVRQGQLIARIDPRDYEMQLSVARAQYEQVKSEFDRLTELKKRESLSDNDFEKAAAGEQMLRSQLQHARDQLNDTRLEAPFSGYIQSVRYREGELVNTGMPVATLLDVRSYTVEADLPLSLFMQKEHFDSYWCRLPLRSDSLYPLQLMGYQAKTGNSQLRRTTFRLDPGLNSLFVPGMAVGITVRLKDMQGGALTLPLTAVFYEDGRSWVWTYDPASSTVKRQEVVTGGLGENGRILISAGLAETDEVVVSGVRSLHEGQTVEPMQPPAQTNEGGLM